MSMIRSLEYKIYLQFFHQFLCSGGRYYYMSRAWADEAFFYCFIDERQQWIVVSIHI